LKGKWKFKGVVVSDWGSVGEMINHGYAKDNKEAALEAVTAGCDMDMESRSYIGNLAALVREGKVKPELIDEAVRRILTKKFEMGLFDDPFRFCDQRREQRQWNNPENLRIGEEMAKKSIVLLRNENRVLPLSKQTKTIALIGPLVRSIRENLGFWSYEWPDDSARIVSPWAGIQKKLGEGTRLLYAKGCGITDTSHAGFAEAIEAAKQADIVVMDIGEAPDMTGEAKSRSNIHLPGVQEDLVRAIVETGKPVVVLISAGRPLVFNYTAAHATAILYTWWLGTEAGNAIADVLFGDYNPSGKLPISFPRTEGQIPIYYNHFSTGRPARNDSDVNYVSAYTDLPNDPRYPFGFGLSFTQFVYSDLQLSATSFKPGGKLTATVTLANAGGADGRETVQWYVRDLVGSVVRPVKELKGFEQVFLKAGESKKISFTVDVEKLRFYNDKLQHIYEPGEFRLYVGGNSRDVKEIPFTLVVE
ncbi:MAG TPA: glycoside hydrolase family 3 C-terminal domain-containing protein, partial [Puia sp.]|nr:glycoside hydrolase family 3 C-terminal domain-containing protein [Puia sp.]